MKNLSPTPSKGVGEGESAPAIVYMMFFVQIVVLERDSRAEPDINDALFFPPGFKFGIKSAMHNFLVLSGKKVSWVLKRPW